MQCNIYQTFRSFIVFFSNLQVIPEFYDSDGQFLENRSNLNLGTKQDGTRVNHVELPPWATGEK